MHSVAINTTLCYLRQNGKTLMLHGGKKDQDSYQGKWIVPGGHFEPGETPEECVVREYKEETGLDIRNAQLRGIITFVVENTDASLRTCHTFVFQASEFEGELIDSSEGEPQWIEDTVIQTLDIFDKDKIFLPWIYENNKLFSAKFYSTDKELKSHEVKFY